MLILKKFEAFERAVKAFGPWNTWSRGHHLAYGLARGVPYARMERTANDNPWSCWPGVHRSLVALGVMEDLSAVPYADVRHDDPRRHLDPAVMVWVHKVPRVRAARATVTEAAQ